MKKTALLLRILHGGIVLYLFICIGYVYYAALTERTTLFVWIAMLSLIIEGIIIYINKGHCPLIFVQRKFGDDIPFFDLILPHRYAKYAVKFCAVVSIVGILLFLLRIAV